MNTGAFGENFPYSNFHDLNTDWIIKIAKDFLDQYTHIQQTISDGEEAISKETQDSIEQLQTTATNLENLLNEWYTTHSADIAEELATAVQSFAQQADAKAVQTIASIPDDYTALAQKVETSIYFRDLAPANIDNLVTAGTYRLSVSTSQQSSTLPEKFNGATGSLTVYPVLGGTHSAVQVLVDGLRQVFLRYVFESETGISPSVWNIISEQELNALNRYISVQIKNQKLNPTYVVGKFIVHNGNIDTNSSFQYSAPIELNENDQIVLYAKGYSNTVAMISETDSTPTYIRPIVLSIDSNERYYTYIATHHCYVIVCGAIANMSVSCDRYSLLLDNTYSEEIISGLMLHREITWTDGYVSKNGVNYEGTGGRCKKSNALRVPAGYKIYAKAYFDGDNISIFARKNSDNTYTPLVVSDTAYTEYEYIPKEDMDIVVSSDARYEYYVKIVYPVADAKTYDFTNMAMFETFGVIGDSFASGALMTSASEGYTKYNKSWCQILARDIGATCLNFASGGLTTGAWLTHNKGLPYVLSSDPQELYLFTLGINDAYHLTNEPTTPLGSIRDIHADYTENPVSFYGNCGRIIDQVKNHAPNAKIIMFTVEEYGNETYVSPNKSAINGAIIEIANHYNLPCIKQADYWFFRSEFYLDNMVYSHPTAPVYSGMATAIRKMIEKCMVDNFNYFKNTFMN